MRVLAADHGRVTTALAWLALLVATVLQAPAPRFYFDAFQYWSGSVAVAHGRSAYEAGGLELRGAVTPILYLPAALAVRISKESAAEFAVLFENGIIIATLGALLLPRIVAIWRPITPATVWVSAGLSWLLLAPFAPYPLSDLWAATLFVGCIVAVARSTRAALIAGGLAAGLALNIRPAYLLPIAGICLLILASRRLSALWFGGGLVAAALPQVIVNQVHGTGWMPWPPATSRLIDVQAELAAFVIRYDTVAYANVPDPRLFSCDPRMAQALKGETLPSSAGDLAVTYLQHLPRSALYLGEKIGAAVHWPVSIPYFAPGFAVNGLFALATTTVVVVGTGALLHSVIRQGWRGQSLAATAVAVAWLGCLATLTTSATEARFALPLVMIGIAGCASLAAIVRRERIDRVDLRWAVGAVLVALVLFKLGSAGLSHPAAPGGADLAICAAT